VSTAYRYAGDDLITLSYLILNGNVEVGEGGFVGGEELLGFLCAVDLFSIRFVPGDI
jgi:hypothetical protein